ncbi:MAG TPA: hypothetical protein VH437_06425 [Terriglobales bacterium]
MTSRAKKITVRIVTGLVLLWIIFAGFVWWAMRQSPETFGRVMSRMPEFAYVLVPFETMWVRARAGSLQPGDAAPDFNLEKLDKTDAVRLASFSGKQPVVLIFGSYT